MPQLTTSERDPRLLLVFLLGFLVAALLAVSLPAWGQQFADATATHLPSPGPAEFTNQVSVGDLNGDGHLDLVFANGGGFATAGAPEVQRVYINDGSGNFSDESAARLGWSGLCRQLLHQNHHRWSK